MNDPCLKCIVHPCCTKVCKEKLVYLDISITNLTFFMDTFLYDENQNRKSIEDPSLNFEHAKLIGICEKNQADLAVINSRGFSG
jgi:hypothetical protein